MTERGKMNNGKNKIEPLLPDQFRPARLFHSGGHPLDGSTDLNGSTELGDLAINARSEKET